MPTIDIHLTWAQLHAMSSPTPLWLSRSPRGSAHVSEAFVRGRGATQADIDRGRFDAPFGCTFTRVEPNNRM